LAASLPLSHFMMGFSAFLILLNWIARWDWRDKWERLKCNRTLLWFSGLYLACCLGLLKTQNWDFAGERLIADLPVLFTPLIFATSAPFSKVEKRQILYGFIAATMVGVAVSLIYWLTHRIDDIRQISIFIDHIRFSLCVVFSILFSLHLLLRESVALTPKRRIALTVCVSVLLVYLFVAQTLSGIVALLVVSLVFVLTRSFCKHGAAMRWVFRGTVALLLGMSIYTGIITYKFFHDQDKEIVVTHTAKGNPYEFDKQTIVENGHRVGYYVCREEMQAAWRQRSDSVLSPLLEQTLIRYLNSKGLHKDYRAVMNLSDRDIANVEQKIANADYSKFIGLKRALYPTYFSVALYRCNHYIDNSSLMQRVELWNASWSVIRDNWLLGVGLGDYKAELDRQLERQQSSIAYKHNRGSHNQWLTYWLIGGIGLVLYFMCVLVVPSVVNRRRITFIYVACLLVLVVSMLVEDTLCSQTGRMLFAMFLPLLLQNNEP